MKNSLILIILACATLIQNPHYTNSTKYEITEDTCPPTSTLNIKIDIPVSIIEAPTKAPPKKRPKYIEVN